MAGLKTVGIAFHHQASRLGAFGRLCGDSAVRDAALRAMADAGINAYNYGILWNQALPPGFSGFVSAARAWY